MTRLYSPSDLVYKYRNILEGIPEYMRKSFSSLDGLSPLEISIKAAQKRRERNKAYQDGLLTYRSAFMSRRAPREGEDANACNQVPRTAYEDLDEAELLDAYASLQSAFPTCSQERFRAQYDASLAGLATAQGAIDYTKSVGCEQMITNIETTNFMSAKSQCFKGTFSAEVIINAAIDQSITIINRGTMNCEGGLTAKNFGQIGVKATLEATNDVNVSQAESLNLDLKSIFDNTVKDYNESTQGGQGSKIINAANTQVQVFVDQSQVLDIINEININFNGKQSITIENDGVMNAKYCDFYNDMLIDIAADMIVKNSISAMFDSVDMVSVVKEMTSYVDQTKLDKPLIDKGSTTSKIITIIIVIALILLGLFLVYFFFFRKKAVAQTAIQQAPIPPNITNYYPIT